MFYKENKQNVALYIRNFIFGVEDSLVSTVGLISGIAIADVSRSVILITGTVLIFVEAFSMAVGSLLSEHSVEEYVNNKEISMWRSSKGSFIMFVAYFISGFLPLFPYIVAPIEYAFWYSILISLTALFMLGAVSSRIFGTSILKHGFEMLLIGGAAIGVGVAVGKLLHPVF